MPKIVLTAILILFIGFLIFPAADINAYFENWKVPQPPAEAKVKSASELLGKVAVVGQYIFTTFFIIAVILIIIAAFNFLTAQGDAEKIKNARSQILWAAVAIAVALISTGAVQIIQSILD